MMVFLFGVPMLPLAELEKARIISLRLYVLSFDSSTDALALINGTGSRMVATSLFPSSFECLCSVFLCTLSRCGAYCWESMLWVERNATMVKLLSVLRAATTFLSNVLY